MIDMNAPPTPEELLAIGVDPEEYKRRLQQPAPQPIPQAQPVQQASMPQDDLMNAPPTREELIAIGIDPDEHAAKLNQGVQKSPEEHIVEKGSALLSTIQGIRDAYLAAGHEVGSLAGGAVKNIGKIVGSKTLEDLGAAGQASSDAVVEESIQSSPILGRVGKYGADLTAGIAATPASTGLLGGLAAGAVGGGAAALATSDSETPLKDIAKGAGTGAAVVGALGVGSKLLAKTLEPVIKGSGLWASNTDDVVNKVMNAAVSKSGDDVTKVTPGSFLSSVEAAQAKAKTAANALYKARDEYAAGIKATVQRSNVENLVNDLNVQVQSGATEGTTAALAAAKKALGNNSAIPFAKAQELISGLGDEAFTASKAGDLVKSKAILEVKQALEKDIIRSIPDEQLQALHGAATQYYRDIYSPISKLQLDKKMADKYTQDVFVNKFANKVLDTPSAMNALGKIDPNIKEQAIASTVNAIKNASIGDHGLDLAKFAKGLRREVTQNGQAYGDVADSLATYADILSAKVTSGKIGSGAASGSLMQMGLFGGSFALGGPAGLATTAATSKALFLYQAGKLISNPEAQALLKTASTLAQNGKNPAMAAKIADRLMSISIKNERGLPSRFAAALAGGSATE
jgi:hypothetical protein